MTDNCPPGPRSSLRYETGEYGVNQPFFDIANGIIDGLQTRLSYSGMETIYSYVSRTVLGHWFEPSNTSLLFFATTSQIGFELFITFGVAIAVCTWLFALIICCCRCFPRRMYPTQPSGILSLRLQFLAYLPCFAFVATGMIMFYVSIYNFNDILGVKFVGEDIKVTQQNSRMGTDQLNCYYGYDITTNFNELVDSLGKEQGKIIGIWRENSGISGLDTSTEETLNSSIVFTLQQGQEAISQLQDLLKDPSLQEEVYQTEIQSALALAQSSYEALVALQNTLGSAIDETNLTLNYTSVIEEELQDGMNTENLQLSGRTTAASEKIKTVIDSLSLAGATSSQWTVQLLATIQYRTNNIYTGNTWNGIMISFVTFISVISAGILLMITYSAAVIVLRMMQLKGPFVVRINPDRHRRVLTIGYYVFIWTAWIPMAISISFLFYAQMYASTCYTIYTDGAYSFYENTGSPRIQSTSFSGITQNTSYWDFLNNCKTPRDTLYTALNSPRKNDLLTTNEVLNFVKTSSTEAAVDVLISSANLNPNFDQDVYNNYHVNLETVRSQSQQLDLMREGSGFLPISSNVSKNAKQADDSMKKYASDVDDVVVEGNSVDSMLLPITLNTSSSSKIAMQSETNSFYSNFNTRISQVTDDLIYRLQNEIYPAISLWTDYSNSGNVFCNRIRAPVNGLWASSGLIAIFAIPTAFLMLYTATHAFKRRKVAFIDNFTENRREDVVLPEDVVPQEQAEESREIPGPSSEPATTGLPRYSMLAPQSLALVDQHGTPLVKQNVEGSEADPSHEETEIN